MQLINQISDHWSIENFCRTFICIPIKRYSSQGNGLFVTSFLVVLLETPPVISLSARLFKDSKQIDSHVNTSEVGTLPFCSGFEPLAACLPLFVRLHVKMNRNNQKTNSHSWVHVKGEWQPLVSPHATFPPTSSNRPVSLWSAVV